MSRKPIYIFAMAALYSNLSYAPPNEELPPVPTIECSESRPDWTIVMGDRSSVSTDDPNPIANAAYSNKVFISMAADTCPDITLDMVYIDMTDPAASSMLSALTLIEKKKVTDYLLIFSVDLTAPVLGEIDNQGYVELNSQGDAKRPTSFKLNNMRLVTQ